MSGQVVAGLLGSGAVALTWGVTAAVMARSGPAARFSRAGRFARNAGLALPPELVPVAGSRVRRRALAALAVSGPLMAAWAYWYLYVLRGNLDSAGPARMPWLPAMVLAVSMAIMAAGTAAGHAFDAARAGTGPGPRPGGARLRDAVPPVITWLVRLMSLLPALTWILALAAPGRGTPHQAAGPPAWAFALAAAGAIALTAAVERLQLLVLRGRDPASAPAGPALGDAFRAQTALDLPMLAAGPACVTAILLISPLLTATRGSHYGDALFTGYLMVLPGAPLTLLLLRATPWARQYYQKRHPASLAAPPGPASAQNPG